MYIHLNSTRAVFYFKEAGIQTEIKQSERG